VLKLAVFTDEISQDFPAAARLIKEYGAQGLEIRTAWEKPLDQLDQLQQATIRTVAKDLDLELCGAASRAFKCSIDSDSDWVEHFRILERALDACERLGIGVLRVWAFWRQDVFSSDKLLTRLGAIVDRAARSGVSIGLENEPTTLCFNTRRLSEVLGGLGTGRAVALWDPGNEYVEESGLRPFPEAFETIRPFLGRIHIKDLLSDETGRKRGIVFGDGEIDYRGLFQRLVADQYAGWLSLETHWRIVRDVPSDLGKWSRERLFSFGGQEATQRCLERLMQLPQFGGH
jgi:L-ribulose-5-phosphate 3-epimerase